MEEKTTFEKTIATLLENKKFGTLKDVLNTMNPADAAGLFGELARESLPVLFRLLRKDLAAQTFVEMDSRRQELLIRGFTDKELKDIVDELYVDDAADIIEEMPANVVKRILAQTDAETRRTINEILRYPEDSAGSMMTTELVSLRPEMTARDAIARIRETGVDKETVNTCYVTDPGRHLIGVVPIRSIILAKGERTIGEIMESRVISVTTHEDREAVARTVVKYGFTALPVVDGENRLVGIVTVDDVIDVLNEEATEDIEKMAAITPSDKPYAKTSVFEIWKSRIPWLLLLMVSATFTGLIINRFEHALTAYVVLTAYIPMLMDTGGNSGSQASVTIIRGLALGELDLKDIFKIIWKEIRVALMCSATLAAVNFAKLLLFDRVSFPISLVINLTLISTVFIAKVVGSTLPILAKKIGFDPAVMASPFLTTIVDALSLLIYFGFAGAILGF